MRTLEDDLWVYFGHPNEYWRTKCLGCRRKVGVLNHPVEECINCWKIEVWSKSPWFSKAADSFTGKMPPQVLSLSYGSDVASCRLFQGLQVVFSLMYGLWEIFGGDFVAKVSKQAIKVIRSGKPEEQYPDSDVDFLLMIYASSIKERDALRKAVCDVLGKKDEEMHNIPVRRGCWFYDDVLGPWENWHQTSKDYESMTL